MLINDNTLWDFAQAPQSCQGFLKVLLNGYWGKVWILHVSHGSLTFVRLNRFDFHSLSPPPTLPLLWLHLHLGQLCWCTGGAILGIYGITDLWVMGRRFLVWECQCILMLCHLLHNNHKFCLQPQVLGMSHHFSPKYKSPQRHGSQILILWLQEMRCKKYNGYCKIM